MLSDVTDKVYKALHTLLSGNVRVTDDGDALPVYTNFAGYLDNVPAYVGIGSMVVRDDGAKNADYARVSCTIDVVISETYSDYTGLAHAVNDVITAIGRDFEVDGSVKAYIVDVAGITDITDIEGGVIFRKVIRYDFTIAL